MCNALRGGGSARQTARKDLMTYDVNDVFTFYWMEKRMMWSTDEGNDVFI